MGSQLNDVKAPEIPRLIAALGSMDPVVRERARVDLVSISHFAHLYRGEPLMPLLAKFRTFEPSIAIPSAALGALHDMERGTLRFAHLESPGSHISVK